MQNQLSPITANQALLEELEDSKLTGPGQTYPKSSCLTGSRQLYLVSFIHVEIKSWIHSKKVVGSAITTDNY